MKTIWLFVSFIGLFFNVAQAADSLSQSSIQLKGVNAKIVTLKKNLKLTQAQRNQLQKTLKETDKNIAKVTLELKTLNKKMSAKKADLSQLNEQLVVLKASLIQQKKMLGQQLRASYQLGQYEYVQLLLNQQDPATVLRLMTYYNYINKARVETLAEIQKTEAGIQEKQHAVSNEVKQLNQLSEQDQQKTAILQRSQQKRQQILAKLNQQIQTQSSRLKEYQADKKRLEALLVRLKTTAKPSISSPTTHPQQAISWGAFDKAAHHLIWPTQGKLLNRASEPVLRHEPGIFILAPESQPVVSVFPGQVVFADALKGFGLLIIIDHGHGFMTLYANNQTLYCKRGDAIKAGDLIAHVGHTGILTQSGLYFEIRHHGRPLNPLQWLSS